MCILAAEDLYGWSDEMMRYIIRETNDTTISRSSRSRF